MKRLIGPGGRLFADPQPGKDETVFRTDNNSSQYYSSPYYTAHKDTVQPIPPPRAGALLQLNLADFIPAEVGAAIQAAGRITFHSVGDTGAAKVNRSQSVATALADQAAVADTMAKDVDTGGPNAPAFFFHLGDVIYNFGEDKYYYDQFYEPYRAYDRPIFAVPGNHDGMVYGKNTNSPDIKTLEAFQTNFCASKPGLSPDAAGLVRSVMTQPSVYFTLDAPFVSIIGLYSNVLEGPGVISSQNKHFPIGDEQLAFLESELKRLKPQRDAGKRAVIIAVHHPPLSADAKKGGSTGEQADLDAASKAAGLWPDAVLSGHAHLYQRFTRNAGGKETPYIVSGSGGFAATTPRTGLPSAPITVGDHTLVINPIVKFGYLTVTTDAKTLTITFKTAIQQGASTMDSVTVDLQQGKIASGKNIGGGKGVGKKGKPVPKPKAPKKPKKK
jgi:predicted phosphodiesterase